MPEHEELVDLAKEAVSRMTGDSVLDVGTGFGVVVEQVLTTTGCNLTSVDPEAWRFEELEDIYDTEISTGRLELMKEDVEQLPFGDKKFDTTISISSLHHFREPEKGLRNMERVTRKRLVVADWNGKSAGITNPHDPEDLEAPMKRVKSYLEENSYEIISSEHWYMGWKDL